MAKRYVSAKIYYPPHSRKKQGLFGIRMNKPLLRYGYVGHCGRDRDGRENKQFFI
jgi:hypothetical protein